MTTFCRVFSSLSAPFHLCISGEKIVAWSRDSILFFFLSFFLFKKIILNLLPLVEYARNRVEALKEMMTRRLTVKIYRQRISERRAAAYLNCFIFPVLIWYSLLLLLRATLSSVQGLLLTLRSADPNVLSSSNVNLHGLYASV